MATTELLFSEIKNTAVFFNDEVKELIKEHSNWWGKVDSKADEHLGDLTRSLQKRAEILISTSISNKNINDVEKKIQNIANQLTETISLSSQLKTKYTEERRARDITVISNFIEVFTKYRDLFTRLWNNIVGLGKVSEPIKSKRQTSKSEEKISNPVSYDTQNSNTPSYDPGNIKHYKDVLLQYDVHNNDPIEKQDESLLTLLNSIWKDRVRNKINFENNGRAIVFFNSEKPIFRYTISFAYDSKENLNFKVERLLNREFNLDEIENLFPEIEFAKKESFEAGTIIIQNLQPDNYKRLLRYIDYGFPDIRENIPSISSLMPDVASREIQDELDFQSDINAMASVMAFRKVQPPLAIGLFGNWGTGKSFFMNKLQSKIKDLATELPDIYCTEVVHVNFNSWHYSDANLWASLMTKIFEELKRHADGGAGAMDMLYQNLSSTKELIADSNAKLEQLQTERTELEKDQRKIEEEIAKNVQRLQATKTKDILQAVWQNPEVQDKIKLVNRLIPTETIDNIHEAKAKLNEFSSGTNQLAESIKITFRLMKGKKVFAFLMFIILLAICYFILTYTGWFQKGLHSATAIVSALSAFFAQVVVFTTPIWGRIKVAYRGLTSLDKTITELENKERSAQQYQLINIQKELERYKEEEKKQETTIKELRQKETEITNEINDIKSGKKLHAFIESKVTDPRYLNSLGIISWIRKDFEELDFLLKFQHEASTEILKELGKEKVENIFKIDRIVLYIDDLDRCNEDIVVRVLEAIHLLLAFPLFVVVVGVDPRWMHNALSVKYKEFLQHTGKNVEPFTIGQTLFKEPATSFDYLEKIFQIPFALKPMNETGRKRLIDSQLRAIIEQREEKSVTLPSAINAEDVFKISQIPIPSAPIDLQVTPVKKADPALLFLTQEELDFMKDMSFLVGDSPRTIKRYINIYRIIRSHAKFVFNDNNILEHHAAVMILLGIITGTPNLVSNAFKVIEKDTTSLNFVDFIQNQQTVFSNYPESFEKLKNCLELKCGDRKAGDISMEKFKLNLRLVSRFSFRYLD